jgi:hypothetical protein
VGQNFGETLCPKTDESVEKQTGKHGSWAFRWIEFDFYGARYCFPPALSYVSGCTEFWSLAVSEEAHEPFQVLGGGRQQELLGDIPRAPQSHAAQAHLLFQFGEQGFDLVARSLRLQPRLCLPI